MGAAAIAESTAAAIPAGKNVPHDNRRQAEFWTEVVRGHAALVQHVAAWEDLCAHSLEPNPWYEPWFLLPALEHLRPDADLWCVLVYRKPARPKDPPLLCGLIPFERYRPWPRLPIAALRPLKCEFICLGTPVLHRDFAGSALAQILDWTAMARHGALLLDLWHIDAQGPFQQALVDVLYERQLPCVVAHCYNRALLTPATNAEAYLEAAMTCHARQELRRQRRRLAERGPLTIRCLGPGDCFESWYSQFVDLEARGWKGDSGGAIVHQSSTRQFFASMAQKAFDRGRLMLLGLFLDDQPIAFKLNLLAGEGSFAFKICFDETFARFSPGVQLEVENIEQVHHRPEIRWMDSCAIPGHFMISRLWKDRRTIHRLLLPTGRAGAAVLAGISGLRLLRHAVRPKKVV